MPRKKIINEIGMEEDGTAVVPRETVPLQSEIPVVPESKVKAKVKREMSEAQRLNMLKVIEANRLRWSEKKKEKEQAEKNAKSEKREREEALIKAGTHIRVKIEPTKKRAPRAKPVKEEEEDSESESESFQSRPVAREKEVVAKKSQRAPPPPSTTDDETTTTETDDDDYKPKKRAVRKEIKKNLKALRQIDEVIEQSAGNPYLAYLTQKWK